MTNTHTEAEAREKWCPFVHHNSFPTEEGGLLCSVNRDPAHIEFANVTSTGMCLCIASECMLWQWADEDKQRGRCGGGR